MRYVYALLLLLVCSCKQTAEKKGAVTHTGTAVKKDGDEPDIPFLRKRLFTFFESHKHLDQFDTTDNTYNSYWGPVNYPPYAVRAGHIFNEHQVHAMIFYSDEKGAGIVIYQKQNDNWRKLLEDTAINGEPGSAFPYFNDWNKDGQKDIAINHSSSASINTNYDLWLMDKNGDKIYPVKEFSKIINPQVSNERHVISYSTCGCADNCMIMEEYVFKEYELQKLYELNVACCNTSANRDSECVIKLRKAEKAEQQSYSNAKSLYNHVPAVWKEMMKEKYGKR